MKVSTILDQIDLGSIALPEFQRGYVWNREQVRGLMRSLYRKYPVGTLLVWVTPAEQASARGDGELAPGVVKLLLDGQQRITSLYGVVRGKPPRFFDGNPDAFTGLFFNLDDEIFEFYTPAKMKGNPLWVDVTWLVQVGVGDAIQRLVNEPALKENFKAYIARLNAVDQIKEVGLHIEEVTGPDKTVDVVVDIFNKVNSGGTKLSNGDLALAKICASWPEARAEMRQKLSRWQRVGFRFQLEWLLRVINAVLTGQSYFTSLEKVEVTLFKDGLKKADKHVDRLLNLVAARLGLDHDRVLGSRYSFPLLARYVDRRGGQQMDYQERDRLLYWYVNAMLWGRYSGSTETVLAQDLSLIADPKGALDRLIAQLRQSRGDLTVRPNDFLGTTKGARFYPLLYMLTRVWKARDWGTGLELSSHLLGNFSRLELHHIFPKALLKEKGFAKAERNLIANFTFLTKETNLVVKDRDPAEYLPEFASKHPGAIESHWIPMDPALWQIERYHDFLAARRELLAKAANTFLKGLLEGQIPDVPAHEALLTSRPAGPTAEEEEEDRVLKAMNDWVSSQGLPSGEFDYEVVDPDTGDVMGVLDLAWPDGLQQGLSRPVALLINEDEDTEEAAGQAGFQFFTKPNAFRRYVEKKILAGQAEATSAS